LVQRDRIAPDVGDEFVYPAGSLEGSSPKYAWGSEGADFSLRVAITDPTGIRQTSVIRGEHFFVSFRIGFWLQSGRVLALKRSMQNWKRRPLKGAQLVAKQVVEDLQPWTFLNADALY
jgi:hypothetical protein